MAAARKTIIALTIALITALGSYLVLQNYTQLTVEYLSMEGRFPAGLEYSVEFVGPFGNSHKSARKLDKKAKFIVQRIGTPAKNLAAKSITITFSFASKKRKKAIIDLHNVQIFRPYLADLFVSQRNIPLVFDSAEYSTGSRVAIRPNENGKATLKLKQALHPQFEARYVALALFIGLAIFLLIRHISWSSIPAFEDMGLGNKISSQHEFNSVNGLRGIAALLVLFSHTAPGFKAIEMGIALLFVFSGFLLSKPFVINPDRIFSWPIIEQFLIKRIKRILPLYYFYIFVVFLLNNEIETAIRNFLFIEANGHLWPMSQILTFYMMLPFILLVTGLLYRAHRALPILALLAATVAWIYLASEWRPYYSGSRHVIFNLQAFLMGVIGSYLYYDGLSRWQSAQKFFVKHSSWLAVIAALISFFTIAWSAPLEAPNQFIQYLFSQFHTKCAMSVLIIMLALSIKTPWFSSLISNWLFRSIGVIGFSYYVWHGAGIQLVLEFQNLVFGIAEPLDRSWGLTLSSFIVTYFIAVISYSWIERPFFGYRNNK